MRRNGLMLLSLGVVLALSIGGFLMIAGQRVGPEKLAQQPLGTKAKADATPTAEHLAAHEIRHTSLQQAAELQSASPRSLFETSDDLYPLSQELRLRAKQGDAAASIALMDIESECRAFVQSAGTSMPGYDRLSVPDMYVQKHPEARAYVQDLRTREQARCGRFTKQDLIGTYDQKLPLLRQAAKDGNAEAQARLLSEEMAHWDSIPADKLKSTVNYILASGDPQAIFFLSGPMSIPSSEGMFNVPSGSELASYAYVLAACRMGMACGQSSQLLANVCLNGMGCGYASYDALLAGNLVAPDELKTVRQMAQQIIDTSGHHP